MHSFVERARILGIPDGALGRTLAYIRPEEPLRTDESKFDLTAIEVTLDPALVVIDGVTEAMTLHGWHPYDPKDAAAYQHLLVRGWGNAATLEIDHTSKDTGRGQLGSQQKRAGIDGASYELRVGRTAGRGGDSFAEIRVSKDRHGYIRNFASETVGYFHVDTTEHRDGPAGYIQVPGFATLATVEAATEDRIVSWLTDHPRSTTTAIRSAGLGRHVAVGDALRNLEATGLVSNEPGPRNAKLWSVV